MYGSEEDLIKDFQYKSMDFSDLEKLVSDFVGDKTWIAIIRGGAEYSTAIESDGNGKIKIINTVIK